MTLGDYKLDEPELSRWERAALDRLLAKLPACNWCDAALVFLDHDGRYANFYCPECGDPVSIPLFAEEQADGR